MIYFSNLFIYFFVNNSMKQVNIIWFYMLLVLFLGVETKSDFWIHSKLCFLHKRIPI